MKIIVKAMVVALFALTIVGCGCEKATDDKSSIDKNSNNVITPDKISREETDFEKLDQKVVGYRRDGEFYYEISIYFDQDNATNAVMTVVCPDSETAITMRNAMQNFNQNDEVYYNGKTVVYTYNENEFPYKSLSKEETIQLLTSDNFLIK